MANPELTKKPSSLDTQARTLARALTPSSPQKQSATRKLACGLGWFSIGLGMAEVLAPRMVARTVGLQGHEALVRAYGARELASGIGILMSTDGGKRSTWVWARVVGDLLDLSALGVAMARPKPATAQPLLGLLAVAGVAALDLVCAPTLQAEEHAARQTTDYSDRVGFRSRPEEMRGAALDTFVQPPDMRLSPRPQLAAVH
jgi:hypothetical protein